ncbi:MAG: DEAD/DEAH box helicase [Myxococcota bacterium]
MSDPVLENATPASLVTRDDAAAAAFASRQPVPWEMPRGLDEVLGEWRQSGRSGAVLDRTIEGHPACGAALPERLAFPIREALAGRGIRELYRHQAESFTKVLSKVPIVVSTPTASGKSLCYTLPILQRLYEAPEARALLLFPTKALARDQEVGFRTLMVESGLDQGIVTYDGDTPADARKAARERSGVVLSNPDMLHSGILPHHATWARLFSQLEFVVIDEVHSYRGVFGSHLANVIRRLKRVATFHGSEPTFVFASATIGNPAEHASAMLAAPVELIDESGAPQGERRVVVYNPPVVNAELGIRQSVLKVAVRFARQLIRAGVPTLVFGQSRNGVEVMLKYLRDALVSERLDPDLVHGYRGGYLPEQRRRIESKLRAGEIRCVVATNALELGIDVGGLDAVVCAGYPGTIAGLWQRFGRAGRRELPSLALLVTSSAPLDQFFAEHPELLVAAPAEHARIDANNVEILVQHLKCASFELPFEDGEDFGDLSADETREGLRFLVEQRVLHAAAASGGKTVYHWATDAYPAHHVSLRNVGWDNFVIIDVAHDRVLAEMDWRSVHTMLHEQAIYQHAGTQFQVERLDYDNHKAYVRRVKPDYYTDAMTHTRVSITSEDERGFMMVDDPEARTEVGFSMGEVSVINKVVGYKKIRFHTHENVGYGEVRLPEVQMHTASIWLSFPHEFVRRLKAGRPMVIDALRGIANAMHTVACVGLMTDPRDLGRYVGDPTGGESSGVGFDPTLFLYDQSPGGIGLASRLFEERVELWTRTLSTVEGCGCQAGCPACVGPTLGDDASMKALALRILKQVRFPTTLSAA